VRKPRRARGQPAAQRSLKPQLVPIKIELAAAPPIAAPVPVQREMRVIRIAREEVRTRGPGTATAHFVVVRTDVGPQPRPQPAEVARAIKAARASGTQIAEAGELLKRLNVTFKTHNQGE
jgi:hypothetical protein